MEERTYRACDTVSITVRRFGSRHGEPAPEGSRLIAASGYCEKIAAVIPAREYVDGQQVFCGFLM